jgi:hypothetical protein
MNALAHLPLGYQVALVLGALAAGLVVAAACAGLVVALSRRRSRRRIAARRVEPTVASLEALRAGEGEAPRADETEAHAQAAPGAPVGSARSSSPVLDAVAGIRELERELAVRAERLERELERERLEIEASVRAIRDAVEQQRVPETLHRLHEALRVLPGKSPRSQASDRQWHAEVGITDIEVSPVAGDPDALSMRFRLSNAPLRLVAREFRLTSLRFHELRLFDETAGEPVLTVRVEVDPADRTLLRHAVMSCRTGAWLPQLLACRVRMDARQREILLRARHRGVERLRDEFALGRERTALPPRGRDEEVRS